MLMKPEEQKGGKTKLCFSLLILCVLCGEIFDSIEPKEGGKRMEPLKFLVFVGTEGIHHDHVGQGKFLADMLSKNGGIEADFSRNYEILTEGLEPYEAVLFFTDIGELSNAQEKGLLKHQ